MAGTTDRMIGKSPWRGRIRVLAACIALGRLHCRDHGRAPGGRGRWEYPQIEGGGYRPAAFDPAADAERSADPCCIDRVIAFLGQRLLGSPFVPLLL